MVVAKNLLSEFIGTFLLVLTVGCNTVPGASGAWAALSIASVLMVSIYSLGSVSGAHFNPAVTLAYFLNGSDKDFRFGDMALYMLVQFIAGTCGGMTSLGLHGSAMNLSPGDGFGWAEAATVEILYTLMLCFVVLRAAVHSPKGSEYFGLAIGFVIVAGGYAAGFISKGAFNPAVAFGVDIASAGQGVYWSFCYLVFEFVGAALAVGLSKALGTQEPYSMGQTFLSEFLGTFFLVFTVGLNVIGGSPAPALSIGASLMCMIYALGGVSGAHFNPAVTTALTLSGASSLGKLGPYIGAQLLGGLCAGMTYTAMLGKGVPLAPGAGYSWMSVTFAEIVYTFVLCFTVLNVATLPSNLVMTAGGSSKQIYGLAIGFCIVAGGYAIGSVSGGSLNPAVSVGLDMSNAIKGGGFGNCAAYTLFELTGAALAYGAFSAVRPSAKGGEFVYQPWEAFAAKPAPPGYDAC